MMLHELLLARAGRSPDALVYADDHSSLTFGQLADRAEQLAGGLAAKGVRQGDAVALVLPSGIGFAEHFWAVQRLGAVSAAFNPETPREALARRVERVRPRLVVTEDVGLAGASATVPEPEPNLDAVAMLQPTSGTSGEPRAAMATHRNVVAQLEAAIDVLHKDVLVAWVPPWHDMGLVRFVISAVYLEAPSHFVQPAIGTIPQWLSTIERVGATYTAAPDFAYRLACRMVPRGSVDLSSLRCAGNGGEPVRRRTIQAFEEHFGVRNVVIPGYGLAEATLAVASGIGGDDVVADERGNLSCGRPYPGVEVRAGDSVDSPGEILVRGDIVFAGYLDAPEETARTIRDGWLHTGDDGYLDEAGRLFVLGRRRAMIKRGGTVIAPREIEEVAGEVPGVRLAAAVGIPPAEGELTESIAVAVETDHAGDSAGPLEAAVSDALLRRLGMAPQHVLVVPRRTVPRTENGKIRHQALRDLVAATARQ
jgi:acyl-CoA synthetase (AMP-forming)/AMP-acid ligase II